MAQPNARKSAMSCSVPCIRCPRALAMPSSSTKKGRAFRLFFVRMQCNAMQYNTLQYNAMQCNAMQWHSPTLEKTLCHALFLAYGFFGRSPCHPAVPNAMECNIIHYNTMQCNAMQCNAMQCNAMAQPNARKKRYVMLRSSHTVSSGARHAIQQYNAMQCSAVQYTTIQCNAMQCNAMQCNAMAQSNARKDAMSCSVPRIRCPRALAMPSSPIF